MKYLLLITILLIGCGTESNDEVILKANQAEITFRVVEANLFPTANGSASIVETLEVHQSNIDVADRFTLFHTQKLGSVERGVIQKDGIVTLIMLTR